MTQTKKYILLQLEAFAEAHKDVKRVITEFEDQRDILITEDIDFPVVFITPISNTYRNVTDYGFRIYCYDIIQKDRSNTIDNINRTELICSDFAKFFNVDNYNVPFWFINTPQSFPVNDRLIDYCQGHYVDVFVQSNSYSACEIPLKYPIPFPTPSGSTIYKPQFLTCDTVLDCNNLTNYIQNAVLSGSSSLWSGGTVVNNSTFLGDLTVSGDSFFSGVSGNTANFDYYFSGGTPLETIITNIAQSVSPTGGTPFNCSDLTGCTIITDIQQDIFEIQTGLTEAQGDIIALQGLTGDMLTCETVTACTEFQNYVSNAISSGSTFNCDDLTGCTVFTDLQQDVFEIQTGLTEVESSISSLETDFYMMLNFQNIEQFEYRVPEDFAVINLENPLGLTVTMQVNSAAYTTGTTISKFDLFTVDVNAVGYVLLNCQRV